MATTNPEAKERNRLILADTIAAMINQDRVPFAKLAAKLIMNSPTAASWRELAAKAPDKWARSMTEIGKLAGFTERQEVRHNVAVAVIHMSDAALLQRLAELQAELAGEAPGHAPVTIEHQPMQTTHDSHAPNATLDQQGSDRSSPSPAADGSLITSPSPVGRRQRPPSVGE